ncbi:MAG TPA: DUF4388 domain-containing protein [Polyangia bacterium]|jgi:hypothetical protein|nr:DUF4388 domain-containing protein [Polyangia bacterium]
MSSGAKRSLEPGAAASEPAVGFHAKLEGASLWDLVQMECLARSRLVVEVTGEGGVGYLYFDGGRVVHASTQRHRGQEAAFEILGWTHGTFQPSTRSWPSAPTIDMSHESLLLHAAKYGDEQQRDAQRASNLVAFPSRAVDAAVEDALEDLEDVQILELEQDLVEAPDGGAGQGPAQEDSTMSMRNPINPTNSDQTPPQPLGPRAESGTDFPVMLRLSSQGALLRNKGGSDELAEATAYAHRLVQLTGELLGLEEFVALECTFGSDRFLVFTEGDGDVVALRPRADLNLQALRERLGL